MHGVRPIDPGRAIDWGKTSADYARHRPGPPASYYSRLHALGVGLTGQRILDLGTGTGLLARQFARQGAHVVGLDIAPAQIEAARALAVAEGVAVEFAVAPAEATGLAAESFDAVTAMQCWLYFDAPRAIAEVKRLLARGGVLVTSHCSWLPEPGSIARRSEELVLRYNPQWGGANWSGLVPPLPRWAENDFVLAAMFWYDEDIAFTREAWRGRIRACRGIGATLSADEVARFDAEHDRLLRDIAGESFAVKHRIDAHILKPR
jgi:SAM-dependent methyltransferase